MKPEFFLTKVTQDWSPENLTVLQTCIRSSESAMLERTNRISDPLWDTPVIANLRGTIRWGFVLRHLEQAVKNGAFNGIYGHWINLGGSSTYELVGEHTTLTAHHLLSKTESPRESAYRFSRRITNQTNPMLKGFESLEPVADDDEKLHLLLVHGGRDDEFAYLRAYHDPFNRSAYHQLSKNIMLMPMLLPTLEFEPVAEPTVELKKGNAESEAEAV